MDGELPDTQGRYNKVLEIIDKRLIPDEQAKKARGEVFTPLSLVREMLFGLRKKELEAGKQEIWGITEKGDFIDEDESNRIGGIPLEVWRDPESTFLDPANGIGNFPVVAFQMLDYQLGKHGKDSKFRGEKNTGVRRKHIIEKMLFMIEIDKGNVNATRKIFRLINPEAEPNICCADTLSMSDADVEKVFGVDRFTVVMGNPPFQAPQEALGKRGGGDELYMKFVKWSIDLVKPDCYLSFVHPPSWRKPEFEEGRKKSKNTGMFKLMAHDNQLEYLEIHDADDGKKLFNASTRYDFYLLNKRPVYKKTVIKDMLGKLTKIDLKNFGFLPNFKINSIKELIAVDKDETCDLNSCILFERSAYGGDKSWVSSTKSDKFKFPLIHSTPKGGIKYMFSSVNDKGFFGIKKVIFGDSGIHEPVEDLKGEYGMTQHAMAIVVENKKESENLVEFLKSNYFTNILLACMWANFQIDWRLFTYFKVKFWDIDYDRGEELIHIKTEKQEGTLKSKKPGKKAGGARTFFDKTRKRRRV
jgi:hypothetical protein